MGKAKRLKVSKTGTGRTEGLDKQISKEEIASSKGRVKVSLIAIFLFLQVSSVN
jgi:hypothetical protein